MKILVQQLLICVLFAMPVDLSAVTHDSAESVVPEFYISYRGTGSGVPSIEVTFNAYEIWNQEADDGNGAFEQYKEAITLTGSGAGWQTPGSIWVIRGLPLDVAGTLEIKGQNIDAYKVFINLPDHKKYEACVYLQVGPSSYNLAERTMISVTTSAPEPNAHFIPEPLPHNHYVFLRRAADGGALPGKASSAMSGWQNFQMAFGHGKTGKSIGYANFWKGKELHIPNISGELGVELYEDNGQTKGMLLTPQMVFDLAWDPDFEETEYEPGAILVKGFDLATQGHLRVQLGTHMVFPQSVTPRLKYLLNFAGPTIAGDNSTKTKIRRTEDSLTMISLSRQSFTNSGGFAAPTCYSSIFGEHCVNIWFVLPNGTFSSQSFEWMEQTFFDTAALPGSQQGVLCKYSDDIVSYFGDPFDRKLDLYSGLVTLSQPHTKIASEQVSHRREAGELPEKLKPPTWDHIYWSRQQVHLDRSAGASPVAYEVGGARYYWAPGTGRHLKLYRDRKPDNKWLYYQYSEEADSRGMLTRIVEPLGDSPAIPSDSAFPTTPPTGSMVTETTYTYYWDGGKTAPLEIIRKLKGSTTANDMIVGLTRFRYREEDALGDLKVLVTEQDDYYGPGVGDFSTSVTKVFHPGHNRIFAKLPYVKQEGDGSKTVWLYRVGAFNDTTLQFTEDTSSPPGTVLTDPIRYADAAVQTIKFSCFTSGGGNALSLGIDNSFVIPNKSTAEVTFRDKFGRTRRIDTQVCINNNNTAIWVVLSSSRYDYDAGGNVIASYRMIDGQWAPSYEATYENGRKKVDRDESGLVKEYFYDSYGRVERLVEKASSGISGLNSPPALQTVFTYDPDGRVVSSKVGPVTGSTTSDPNALVTTTVFNRSGMVMSETDASGYRTDYDYANINQQKTTLTQRGRGAGNSAFDRTTVKETWSDGTQKSTSGTAVVPTFQSHSIVNLNSQSMALNGVTVKVGTRINISSTGSSTAHTLRVATNYLDWAGRVIKEGSANPNTIGSSTVGAIEATHTYNNRGQKVRTQTTGLAPVVNEFDSSLQMVRSGMKLADSTSPNALNPSSLDRFGEQSTFLEADPQNPGLWWEHTINKTYPLANSSTPLTIQDSRTLRSGFWFAVVDLPQHGPLSLLVDSYSVLVDASGKAVTTVSAIHRQTGFSLTQVVSSDVANPDSTGFINGRKVYHISPGGVREDFIYDAFGRLASVVTRTGATEIKYSPGTMEIIWERSSDNSWTQTSYDPAGRVAWKKSILAKSPYQPADNAPGLYSRFSYNLRGQLVRQWGDVGFPVENTYYQAGQSQQGFSPGLEGELYDQDTFNATTSSGNTIAWNGSAWPTGTGTPNKTRFQYFPENGLLKEKWYRVTTAPTWQKTIYEYNRRRQLSKRIWQNGKTSTYSYRESVGQNTGELSGVDYSDPAETDLQYTYTRNGHLATVVDASGARTYSYRSTDQQQDYQQLPAATYGAGLRLGATYDASGRYSGYWFGSGVSTPTAKVDYEFDASSGRLSAIDTSSGIDVAKLGKFRYSYLQNSDLISRIDGPPSPGDQLLFTRAYAPDANRLTDWTISLSGTALVGYSPRYDNLNRLEKIGQTGRMFQPYGTGLSLQYGYDNRNQLTRSTTYLTGNPDSIGGAVPVLPRRDYRFNYDTSGNRVSTQLDAEAQLTYLPNLLGQYASRVWPGFVDTVGLIGKDTTVSAFLNGTAFSPSLSRHTLSGTSYDYFHGKMTRPTPGTAAKETLRLDTLLNGSGVTLSDTRSRLMAPSTVAESFTHDTDGNLTQDAFWTYVYDSENRLKEASTRATLLSTIPGIKVDFTYDYLGRRVRKRVWNYVGNTWVWAKTTVFLYSGWSLLAEFDGPVSGNSPLVLTKTYYWGLDQSGTTDGAGGIGGLLGYTLHGSVSGRFAALSDINGNVSALVDLDTGAVAAEYEYSPFGELTRASGPQAGVNPWRFSSKYFDSEIGLSYFGYRYYSASLGRFVNRDPVDELGQLTLSSAVKAAAVPQWSYSGALIPPEKTPRSSLADASLAHSNDRDGGFRNSTQPGDTLRHRKGNDSVDGGGAGGQTGPGQSRPASHAYAFVRNNPVGAIDPLGLFELGDLLRSLGGSYFSVSATLQSALYGDSQWTGYQNFGAYPGEVDPVAYFNSGAAWDLNNPSEAVDFLLFQERFSDTRLFREEAQSSFLGMTLGPLKSGIEMFSGQDLWTGRPVDRERAWQSFALESMAMTAGAVWGLAESTVARSMATPAMFGATEGSRRFRLNIFGENEAPGFLDVATNARYATGTDGVTRRLTSSLPSGSASDIFIRSSPVTGEGTIPEIMRLSRPGTRITYMLPEPTVGNQGQALINAFGQNAVQSVRTFTSQHQYPGNPVTIIRLIVGGY